MVNVKQFFLIEHDEIVLNEHILMIPKFRAIKEAYKDPMPAFKFLRYKYDMRGPYSDLLEEEKEDTLLKDFPGEYTLEDKVMLEVIEWLDSLMTPTERYYVGNKRLLEKTVQYFDEQPITEGRDGNIGAIQKQLAAVGKTIMEFKKLQLELHKEIDEFNKPTNRGSQESGYDE